MGNILLLIQLLANQNFANHPFHKEQHPTRKVSRYRVHQEKYKCRKNMFSIAMQWTPMTYRKGEMVGLNPNGSITGEHIALRGTITTWPIFSLQNNFSWRKICSVDPGQNFGPKGGKLNDLKKEVTLDFMLFISKVHIVSVPGVRYPGGLLLCDQNTRNGIMPNNNNEHRFF